MRKLLLLILLAPFIALAHDKPKPPPKQEQPPAQQTRDKGTHRAITVLAVGAAGYGLYRYCKARDCLQVKVAETGGAVPMVAYERRF